MVLESILTPQRAERHPMFSFFLGAVYATVGVFLSLWIFASHAALVMVFFTVIASLPLFYKTIAYEESKDHEVMSEVGLLLEHAKAIRFFLALFCGVTVAFSLWYLVLPQSTTATLFKVQLDTIANINSDVTGNFINTVGIFSKIFFNNLKVLIFCILFSFIYGAGAIFILVWNASVIGAAVGNFAKGILSQYAHSAGLVQLGGYFHAYSFGILRYAIHGIPEILAYVVGGLAGGILSVAVIKRGVSTQEFETIIVDASDLLIIALVILFVAAVVEVWVTPVLF